MGKRGKEERRRGGGGRGGGCRGGVKMKRNDFADIWHELQCRWHRLPSRYIYMSVSYLMLIVFPPQPAPDCSVTCPAGHACPSGGGSPTPCPEGQYSFAGQGTCQDCPRGFRSDLQSTLVLTSTQSPTPLLTSPRACPIPPAHGHLHTFLSMLVFPLAYFTYPLHASPHLPCSPGQ